MEVFLTLLYHTVRNWVDNRTDGAGQSEQEEGMVGNLCVPWVGTSMEGTWGCSRLSWADLVQAPLLGQPLAGATLGRGESLVSPSGTSICF